MKILFYSNWIDNPYKSLLSESLQAHGAEIEELMQHSNVFLFDVLKQNPEIFHMHLLRELIAADSTIKRALKYTLLITQLLILKLKGIKIAWTVHDWDDKIGLGKYEVERWRCKILGRLIDVVIVHCDSTATMINQGFNLEKTGKVHVVQHGNYFDCYPETTTRDEARKKLGIDNNTMTFLLFGGVHRYKGVGEMIDAIEQVDADIKLVIAGKVGDDSLGRELTEKSNDSSKILFIPGLIDDDDVYQFFVAADCIAMPYQVYTTSGVALLAISFGRACLAPKTGFFSDVLRSEGTFFYEHNAKNGLTDAVKHSIAHKNELPAMGEFNRSLASLYDWDSVGQKTWAALTDSG